MAKTFKELLEEAQFSESEIEHILNKVGLATIGATLKKVEAMLPAEVAEKFIDLDDEERIKCIMQEAPKHISKETLQSTEQEVRLELTMKFYNDSIKSRLVDNEQ